MNSWITNASPAVKTFVQGIKFGAILAMFALVSGCVSTTTTVQTWMSPDVKAAWDSGYKGQGTTITVVDSFSGSTLKGTLSTSTEQRTHGGWTALQAQMLAPDASVRQVDYDRASSQGYALGSGLNVINNSYSAIGTAALGASNLPNLEKLTVQHAQNGTAIVVKSAGNDAVPVGSVVAGQRDVFGAALIGAPAAIFVGALSTNGTPNAKARMASYSNTAGSNAAVQSNFLVVGVESADIGLAGTSFAAPIVAGYAAILGSKFTSATPTDITNQLLNTARTDTIQGYSPSVHGRGEASLSRALAPSALK